MQNSMRLRITLTTLALVLAGGSTARAQHLKVFALAPPEQPLPGVRKLAVLDLAAPADYGAAFADYLIRELMVPNRGMHELNTGFLGLGKAIKGQTLQDGSHTDVYELIERSRLSQVLGELRLSNSGLVDQSQAAQIGKMLGVDAVLAGTLTPLHADKRGQRQIKQTVNGQQVSRIVNCVERQVEVTVRVRVVRVETAQILATAERKGAKAFTACEPDPGLPPVRDLINAVADDIAGQVADYVAPHFDLQDFDLEKIRNKETRELGDRAGKLAEDLEVDQAYAIYQTLREQDPYSPAVNYDMGVLNEVVGNYREAQEFYQNACQLRESGNCTHGLERVDRNLAFHNALESLGIVVGPHVFGVTAELVQVATAKQVEIKGDRDERIPVYGAADETSPVVASVPGGVTFTVLAEEGDWVKIQLLGGQEGYVQRDKTKSKD